MQDGPAEPETPLPDDLNRWVAADLLTLDQAERIARFERERDEAAGRGRASRSVALLGALTLICGVGSLVAYNWDRLSDGLKLGGLGILLVLALGAVLRAKRPGRAVVALGSQPGERESASLDVALLISTGLTLAGLSLVSQIYHQDGEVWQLLFAWSLVTAPLMSFARTRFAHVFWYVALFVSLVSSFGDASDLLRRAIPGDSDYGEWACLLLFGTLSVVLAARFAGSQFPGRASVGRAFVRLLLIVLGLFGGLTWFHNDEGKFVFWALGLLSSGAIFVSAPPALQGIGWGSVRRVQLLFGVGILLMVLPLGFSVESSFAAFVSFVLFWGLAWFLAERAGSTKNARLAVLFIGGRVLIASFELFESLLVTGGVLVGLGLLALVWSRHSLRKVAGKEVTGG